MKRLTNVKTFFKVKPWNRSKEKTNNDDDDLSHSLAVISNLRSRHQSNDLSPEGAIDAFRESVNSMAKKITMVDRADNGLNISNMQSLQQNNRRIRQKLSSLARKNTNTISISDIISTIKQIEHKLDDSSTNGYVPDFDLCSLKRKSFEIKEKVVFLQSERVSFNQQEHLKEMERANIIKQLRKLYTKKRKENDDLKIQICHTQQAHNKKVKDLIAERDKMLERVQNNAMNQDELKLCLKNQMRDVNETIDTIKCALTMNSGRKRETKIDILQNENDKLNNANVALQHQMNDLMESHTQSIQSYNEVCAERDELLSKLQHIKQNDDYQNDLNTGSRDMDKMLKEQINAIRRVSKDLSIKFESQKKKDEYKLSNEVSGLLKKLKNKYIRMLIDCKEDYAHLHGSLTQKIIEKDEMIKRKDEKIKNLEIMQVQMEEALINKMKKDPSNHALMSLNRRFFELQYQSICGSNQHKSKEIGTDKEQYEVMKRKYMRLNDALYQSIHNMKDGDLFAVKALSRKLKEAEIMITCKNKQISKLQKKLNN